MRQRAAHGFSLIEAMVALIIAATVISGFYNALSTGSLLDRRAAQQAEKVLVATNVLDRVGVDIPLRLGAVETGTQRALEWELIISDTPTDDMQLGPIYPNEMVFLAVSVTDPLSDIPPVVIRAMRYMPSPL